MRKALLDTDTISFFFREAPSVIQKANKYMEEHGNLNISIVSYYEILNGLYYKDAKGQLSRFEKFIELNQVLSLTSTSAKTSAKIYAELRKHGNVIGHNDILIAGIALENDLTLITNNTAHFQRIKNLKIENWFI